MTHHDARLWAWLEPTLRALDVEVVVAPTGLELDRSLFSGGPFDLVIANASVAGPTGLQVLAKARTMGLTTPFIIVMSLHGDLVRVMVSDVRSTTLSSRVVGGKDFVALAMGLVRPSTRSGPTAHG